ncbi:hypothetical protein [uncultured Arcobacter sp.]|uniref:hypothetical protein n=1 Tax=uncultured Arcobacter sp. TaxID=165434 RepID=UPI00260AD511|nr:hypothetical protein [uncultured Arcobacter sp.]
MILSLTILTGCFEKDPKVYIPKPVIKIETVKVSVPVIPKCINIDKKVIFHKCGNSYCLDETNAKTLIVKSKLTKSCLNQWNDFKNQLCSDENTICEESK